MSNKKKKEVKEGVEVAKVSYKGQIGGYRPNSGRPKKSDELAMIEKLKPLEAAAHIQLAQLVEDGNIRAIELYFSYMYGKPKQIVTVKQDKDDTKQVFKIGGKSIEL